jgi:hypothetical protein
VSDVEGNVADPGIVPGDAMLVRVTRVVLLGHVVAEQDVRERFVAVREAAGNVDGNRVLVADVVGERLIRREIEHDDAGHPAEAGEEVVLAALVVVQGADYALPREDDVGLPCLLRQPALAPQLDEPAALVLEAAQRNALYGLDHTRALFTPCFRTKSLTA